MTNRISRVLLAAALATTAANHAQAREPGVPTSVPPGNTMGAPMGANPPPGLYFSNRNGFWDAVVYNNDGDKIGQQNMVTSTAAQIIWVPDITVLGGTFRAYTTIPLMLNEQTREDPFPPSMQGTEREFALSNIEIAPIALSWQLSPGIFASAGLSIFAPTGKFDPEEAVNTGGDFWTLAPSAAISYLRNGWNLTANGWYFFNTESRDTDYQSGQEFLLNLTAMKDFGDWSVGPVGYWRVQTTADENNGDYYGGAVADKAEQAAAGLGVTHRFGAVETNVNFTRDFYVRNAAGGNKLWVNLSVPF